MKKLPIGIQTLSEIINGGYVYIDKTAIALDLIKEYDPNGKRTVGILTKLDLMNQGTNITNLLENNVSKDLQLKYGYFGIKNRNLFNSAFYPLRLYKLTYLKRFEQ